MYIKVHYKSNQDIIIQKIIKNFHKIVSKTQILVKHKYLDNLNVNLTRLIVINQTFQIRLNSPISNALVWPSKSLPKVSKSLT